MEIFSKSKVINYSKWKKWDIIYDMINDTNVMIIYSACNNIYYIVLYSIIVGKLPITKTTFSVRPFFLFIKEH